MGQARIRKHKELPPNRSVRDGDIRSRTSNYFYLDGKGYMSATTPTIRDGSGRLKKLPPTLIKHAS